MLTVDTILGNEQWSGEAWPDRNGYSKTSNGFQTETDRDHETMTTCPKFSRVKHENFLGLCLVSSCLPITSVSCHMDIGKG